MSASEFELLRTVTLGQYLPTGSAVHRADPRIKLLAGLLLVVAVTAMSSIAGLCLSFALVLVGFLAARIPLGYALSGVKPMLPFLAILGILQAIAIPQNDANTTVFWRWAFITLTARDAVAVALLFLKFSVLVWGLSLLSFTTTTTELTHGTEHLLRPLQRVGLPAHEFALTLNVALRFVPLLAQETERLMKAQASRGADFGAGRGWNFVRRFRRLIPLLVPLILSTLQRAEDLILAMEARCYTGGKGRTYLVHFRARASDYAMLALVVVVLAAALAAGATPADALVWRAISTLWR